MKNRKRRIVILFSFLLLVFLLFGRISSQRKYFKLEKKIDAIAENRDIVTIKTQEKEHTNTISPIQTDKIQRNSDYLVQIYSKKIIANSGSITDTIVTYLGNGIILDKEGYILTNNHVVHDLQKNYVIAHKRKEYTIKNIWLSQDSDLAILKMNNFSNDTFVDPQFQLLSRVIQKADFVWSIGINELNNTHIHQGVINLVEENIGSIQNPSYTWMYQTDIPGKAGDSGSILVDKNGYIIGINTSINLVHNNYLYAIPLTERSIKNMLVSVKEDKKFQLPKLGIQYEINKKGYLILSTLENGLARSHGIKKGQIITKINGKPLPENIDLETYIRSQKIGERVVFTISENEKQKEVIVIITDK